MQYRFLILTLVLGLLKTSSGRTVIAKEPCNIDKCNPSQLLNGFALGSSKWDFQKITYPFPLHSAQPTDALDYLTADLSEEWKPELQEVLEKLQGSSEGTWAFKLVQWDSQIEAAEAHLAEFNLNTAGVGGLQTPLKRIDLEYFVFGSVSSEGSEAAIEVKAEGVSLANLTKSQGSEWDSWGFDLNGDDVTKIQVIVKAISKYSFVLINVLEADVDCSAYAEEGDCEYDTTTQGTTLQPTASTSAPSDATSFSTSTEGPTSVSTSTAGPTTEGPISSTTVDDECTTTRIIDTNEETWIQNSMGSLRYFKTSADLTSADIPGFVDFSKLQADGVWLQLPRQSPSEPQTYFQLQDTVGIKSVTVRYFASEGSKVRIVASQNGRVLKSVSSEEEMSDATTEDGSLWQETSVHFEGRGVTEVKVYLDATGNSSILMDSITASVPCRSDSEVTTRTTTAIVTSLSTDAVTSTTVATSTEITEKTTLLTSTTSTTSEGPSSTTGKETTETASSISTVSTESPTTPCGQFQVIDQTAEPGTAWKVNFEDKFRYFETSEDLKDIEDLPESIDIDQLKAKGLWLLKSPLANSDQVPHFTLEDSHSVLTVAVRYFSFGNASLTMEAVGGKNESLVDNGGPLDGLWRQMRMAFENVEAVRVIPTVATEDSLILIDSITAEITCTTEKPTSTTAPPKTDPSDSCKPQLSIDIQSDASKSAWTVDLKASLKYFNHTEELKRVTFFPKEIDIDALNATGVWMQLTATSDGGAPIFLLQKPSGVASVTVRYFIYGNGSAIIEAYGNGGRKVTDLSGTTPTEMARSDGGPWRYLNMLMDDRVLQIKVIPKVYTEDSVILIDFISADFNCSETKIPTSTIETFRDFTDSPPDPSATCKPQRSIDTAEQATESAWKVDLKASLKYFNRSEEFKQVSYFPKEIDIDALSAEGIWMQRTATNDEGAPFFLLDEPNGVINVTVRYYAFGNGSVVIEAFGSRDQKAVEEKMPLDGSPWRYLSMQLDDHVSQIKILPKVRTEDSAIMIDSITAFANCEPPAISTTLNPTDEDSSTGGSAGISASFINFSISIGAFVLFRIY